MPINQVFPLDYEKATGGYLRIIRFALQTSDSFSLVTTMRKPYSEMPARSIHDELLSPISAQLMSQIVNARNWPGTETRTKHKLVNRYRIDGVSARWLENGPNLFRHTVGQPEDLCFYRGETAWLGSTTHEGFLWVVDPTEKDRKALLLFFPEGAGGKR